jgi:hypothetical protein
MQGYTPDPETRVVNEHFAVIYAPRRRRDRFPVSCVELKQSEPEARQAAAPEQHRYAARVMGPARSSEGQCVYYLVAWLD